jgi:KDO2-lipid IV(A) lauroyltransferase
MPPLVRWLSRRSLTLLHAIGGVVGWLGYGLSSGYRRRLQANANQAGVPREVWRASITQAGCMVSELPALWLRPPAQRIDPPLQWDGAERIDAALAGGRGLVLMTPHLGCFEICAQAYAERWGAAGPITVLFRPARKPWLRELMDSSRARPGVVTAPASLAGVRQMIRALRRGETVGLLPDQVPPDGMGVWAPWFGRDAYTMTLAARLVQQTGAALLLMVGERLPSGSGYRIHVLPMEEALPEGSASDEAHLAACAAVINRAMERLIRRWPQQYLWGYDRYKPPRAGGAAG